MGPVACGNLSHDSLDQTVYRRDSELMSYSTVGRCGVFGDTQSSMSKSGLKFRAKAKKKASEPHPSWSVSLVYIELRLGGMRLFKGPLVELTTHPLGEYFT